MGLVRDMISEHYSGCDYPKAREETSLTDRLDHAFKLQRLRSTCCLTHLLNVICLHRLWVSNGCNASGLASSSFKINDLGELLQAIQQKIS